MAKITITIEDKADGPKLTLSPEAHEIVKLRDAFLPKAPEGAVLYALIAIGAIGKLSKDATTAGGKLKGMGIILPN